jgi:CubicO group peptidase (beta-lactamase class C family)
MKHRIFAIGLAASFIGPMAVAADLATRTEQLNREVPQLLKQYKVAGAGIAIIQAGKVQWTGYYGEQGPGVPASAKTVFNSASVAKTVTAETLLALASRSLISLDEPIYKYVTHADLGSDPRFKKLTARLLLSHRAGLRNWPYEYENGRAAFIAEPGTSFSYSGMGVELAARYAESKLHQDFEELAFKYVLTPLGISEMSLGRHKPWMQARLATPMDANGKYLPVEPRLKNAGIALEPWSAADDLFTTVDAYSRFLVAVIDSTGLAKSWLDTRTQLLTSLAGDPIWNCEPNLSTRCAERYGHGLGWMVYELDGKRVVKHGGNDKGENALVLYSPESRNGAVILINGGNGVLVSTQILGIVGVAPEIAAYYRQLVKKFYNVELPVPSIH